MQKRCRVSNKTMSKKIVVTGYTDLGEQKNLASRINTAILVGPEEMDAHDGYHSFTELYDHRITLYIAFAKKLVELVKYTDLPNATMWQVWRSEKHADGSVYDGWFIMGIGKARGEQISYHLPMSKWGDTQFAETLETAPEWDGHSPADVLERIRQL